MQRFLTGFALGHQLIGSNYVVELYKKILQNYPAEQNPLVIHSDLKDEYTAKKVEQLLRKEGIERSAAIGSSHQNQVSESVNDQIKSLVVKIVSANDTRPFRALRSIQLPEFKGKSNTTKAGNSEYRRWLFSTEIFQQNAFSIIQDAIQVYNKQDFTTGVSRQQAEFYNTKIQPKTMENLHLVTSKDKLANQIKKINIEEVKEVEQRLTQILNSNSDVNEKLVLIESLLIEGQNSTQGILRYGFVGLAKQNCKLLNSNEKLNDQLEEIQQKFNLMLEELMAMKEERHRKEEFKKARAKRKRHPKRQPVTPDIYEALIQAVNGKSYKQARLRIALCLLAVTGIRVSELLPLKVSQIKTLLESHWIAISRSKRGPSSHKAFLTKEGKRIVQDRTTDFQLICMLKEPDSYIFTSETNHNRMLTGESITKTVNLLTKLIAQSLPTKPNITSHSFRIG